MSRPTFTQEQKDWICYQIGEWYVSWKDRLINFEDKTHKLGYAKEVLKMMVCDSPEDIKHTVNDILKGLRDLDE